MSINLKDYMTIIRKCFIFFIIVLRAIVRSSLFVVTVFGVFGWMFYKQYQEQHRLADLVQEVQQHSKHAVVGEPGCAVGPDNATVQSWSDIQSMTRDTVAQVIAQVAQFDLLEPYKTPAQGQVAGSAFFINEQGELITNAHVVNQAKAVFIQIPSLGKRRLEVDVIGISPDRDLALLRLKPEELILIKETLGKVPRLFFGDSDKVSRAEEIMALGYPLGQQSLKSTTGVVSGREHISGKYMIQISTAINPGSSGGPSINRCGQVVGVNTAGIMPAQNVNYIIPSNEVQLFLKQIGQLPEKDPISVDHVSNIKFLRRPVLGVMYNNATDDLAKFFGNPQPGGLYIVETLTGSPLHKIGVKTGDMMYEINGHKLDVFGDMTMPGMEDKMSITDYVSGLMLGDLIHIKIYRNGKEMDLSFKLDHSDPNGVRQIYPGYESIDYEIIGGMVVMQLSLNHVQGLLSVAPELARYAEPKTQLDPALIITHVMPDSAVTRARSIGLGAVFSEVNGEPVKTLDDFRNAVKKSLETGVLTIKTIENTFAVFPFPRILTDEKKLSENYYYKITDFVQGLIKETQSNHDKKTTQAA